MFFEKLKLKVFFIFSIFLIGSCMDPYNVDVNNFDNLLVVEALVTDEVKSHEVKISRSISNLGQSPEPEKNAKVVISDQNGTEEVLTEKAPGIYKTDSVKFRAIVGNSYKLSIMTSDGEKYTSNVCEMQPESKLNQIYYIKDKIINVNNDEVEGIRFFINGEAGEASYIRWIYDETWKFSVLFPTHLEFNSDQELISIPVKNAYCWKNKNNEDIVIQSMDKQFDQSLNGKSICFVSTGINDRFNIKYSILIKQLSISKEEYNFWNKLKESSEDIGDIFGSQAFSVSGNIKNIENSKETVLGYFQVGTVASKRIFISNNDVKDLELNNLFYREECVVDTVYIDNKKFHSLYSLYEYYVIEGDYALKDVTIDRTGILLTEPTCADCSLIGSTSKPKFWED